MATTVARGNKLDELHLTWRPSIDNDQEQSESGTNGQWTND